MTEQYTACFLRQEERRDCSMFPIGARATCDLPRRVAFGVLDETELGFWFFKL